MTQLKIKEKRPPANPDSFEPQWVSEKDVTMDFAGMGHHWEADASARCLRDGELESKDWTHEDTLLMLQVSNCISIAADNSRSMTKSGRLVDTSTPLAWWKSSRLSIIAFHTSDRSLAKCNSATVPVESENNLCYFGFIFLGRLSTVYLGYQEPDKASGYVENCLSCMVKKGRNKVFSIYMYKISMKNYFCASEP